jgi:antitoxin component YwqK of YwqJK toxin-antitoxin module
MRSLLIATFTIAAFAAYGQATIPMKFKSEDANKLIKETDSVKYYEATGDMDDVVTIDEDNAVYKLLGKGRKVIDEGGFVTDDDKYYQDGKWTEHFENGKTSITGSYRRGKPVGVWKSFYQEGHIKSIYNYGIILENGIVKTCLSGSYEEFFPDGKVKVNGYYAAVATDTKDTVTVEDPVTGEKTIAVSAVHSYKGVKTGHWEYYNEDGEIEKKEDF